MSVEVFAADDVALTLTLARTRVPTPLGKESCSWCTPDVARTPERRQFWERFRLPEGGRQNTLYSN